MQSIGIYDRAYLLLGVAVATISFIGWRINTAFRGPLAHLPGPTYSKFTNLRLKFAVLTGERTRYVHSLHQIYGPIVRISPWEVSLADIGAAKTIYKVGGTYLKSDFYDAFTGNQKYSNLFATRDYHWHGQHRRLLAANFAEKNVAAMEPYISKNVKLAVARIAEESQSKGFVDVFKWFIFMATDVIGEAAFGESFRLLETGQKNQYIRDLELIGRSGILRVEFPLFFKIMRHVPIGPSKQVLGVISRLAAYANESTQRYWKQLQADPENIKPTLLTKEYAEVENGIIDAEQLMRDAQAAIVAGTDTTAVTVTYAVWFLANNPEIQQAVIEEVAGLSEGFMDEDLRSLKLLGNVLQETLRLRSAVGQGLPRIVPPSGAQICGYFVPEKAVVGIPAWSMHRDPAVWPEPEHFDPSRWNEPSKDMLHSFLPFGGGSRVCIGSHFAMVELRHALANFYRTFPSGMRPSSAEGFRDADMVVASNFLAAPRGKRCLVEVRK